MKAFILGLVLLATTAVQAQLSISGGVGKLNGVGTDRKPFILNLGIEFPRSSDLTFFMRATYGPRITDANTDSAYVTAIDLNTTPSTLTIPYSIRCQTFYVEGGTRSYMLNDYDNGFALYGGTVFGFGINTTDAKFSKYDVSNTYEWEGKYKLPNNNPTKGSIYYLALGIQGGMKYTIPVKGTIFFDITGTYSVLDLANNNAGTRSFTYSPLNFLFQLGYRKDLY